MKRNLKKSDDKNYTPWLIVLFLIIILAIIFRGNISDLTSKSEIKKIEASGMNQVLEVAYTGESKIIASGLGSKIYVHKDANPVEVIASGMNSEVYLCEGFHHPTTETSGLNAKIQYGAC